MRKKTLYKVLSIFSLSAMHLSVLSGAAPQRLDLAPTQNTALFGFLHPDFRALENELSVLQTQFSTVEQQLQTLNPPSTPAQVFTKRISTLETRLQEVLNTFQNQTKKSEQTNAICEHLRTCTAKHDGQINALQSTVDILKRSHDELRNENASLKKRLTELDSKIKSVQVAHQEALSRLLKEGDKKHFIELITELTSLCEFLKTENLVLHEKIESLKEKFPEPCQTPTSTKQDSLASTVRLESLSPLEEKDTPPTMVVEAAPFETGAAAPAAQPNIEEYQEERKSTPLLLRPCCVAAFNMEHISSQFNDFIDSQSDQDGIIHKILNQETLTTTESITWTKKLINLEKLLLTNVMFTLIVGLPYNPVMQIDLNYIAEVIEAEFLRSGNFQYAIRLLEKSRGNNEVSIVIANLIFSRLSEENFKLCYEKNPAVFQTSLDLFQENMKGFTLIFHINDVIFLLQILYKAMFSLEKSKNLPLTKYKIILEDDANGSLRLSYNKEGAIIEDMEVCISEKIKLKSEFIKSYFESMRRK
ncbi:MAG: hypothetical protein NEHIOOID_00108 [Holosporales bacterium]